MKIINTITGTAIAMILLSACSSKNSSGEAADNNMIAVNPPANLALAVVDDNAQYNYFDKTSWGALDARDKSALTPVGVCVMTDKDSIIVALHDTYAGDKTPLLSGLAPVNSIPVYDSEEKALADMDGAANCAAMTDEDCDATALKYIRDEEIVNVNSTDWYIPSLGQMMMISENLSRINDALKAFGGEHIRKARHWSSTQGNALEGKATFWLIGLKDNYTAKATPGTALYVRPVMNLN